PHFTTGLGDENTSPGYRITVPVKRKMRSKLTAVTKNFSNFFASYAYGLKLVGHA
ncbi:MAG: hypothetical protein ACI934_001739, partial [Pseudohongiellaceae bacterium]